MLAVDLRYTLKLNSTADTEESRPRRRPTRIHGTWRSNLGIGSNPEKRANGVTGEQFLWLPPAYQQGWRSGDTPALLALRSFYLGCISDVDRMICTGPNSPDGTSFASAL
jgi:hypothetical protein